MRMSIPGLVLVVVMYCVEFILFTYYVIGCHSYISSWHSMMNETRNFIDEVIDTREITPTMEADFALALASNDVVYHANIYREIKKIDPDPSNLGTPTSVGGTITTWIVTDDHSKFNTGDRIVVETTPISVGPYEAIANIILRLPADTTKVVKAARVR